MEVQYFFTRYAPLIHSFANDDAALIGLVRAGTAAFITGDYPQIYSRGAEVCRHAAPL